MPQKSATYKVYLSKDVTYVFIIFLGDDHKLSNSIKNNYEYKTPNKLLMTMTHLNIILNHISINSELTFLLCIEELSYAFKQRELGHFNCSITFIVTI